MCYYKGMKVSRNELLELLEIDKQVREEEYKSKIHSGFEYRAVDIIVLKAGCKWDLVEMEWGFIPQNWWTRNDVEKICRGYMDEKANHAVSIVSGIQLIRYVLRVIPVCILKFFIN